MLRAATSTCRPPPPQTPLLQPTLRPAIARHGQAPRARRTRSRGQLAVASGSMAAMFCAEVLATLGELIKSCPSDDMSEYRIWMYTCQAKAQKPECPVLRKRARGGRNLSAYV